MGMDKTARQVEVRMVNVSPQDRRQTKGTVLLVCLRCAYQRDGSFGLFTMCIPKGRFFWFVFYAMILKPVTNFHELFVG